MEDYKTESMEGQICRLKEMIESMKNSLVKYSQWYDDIRMENNKLRNENQMLREENQRLRGE